MLFRSRMTCCPLTTRSGLTLLRRRLAAVPEAQGQLACLRGRRLSASGWSRLPDSKVSWLGSNPLLLAVVAAAVMAARVLTAVTAVAVAAAMRRTAAAADAAARQSLAAAVSAVAAAGTATRPASVQDPAENLSLFFVCLFSNPFNFFVYFVY